MEGHKTIQMRPLGAPDGVTVGIDIGIAQLISALWDAEIDTCNSCQDRASEAIPKPGIAWVQFASAGCFETFLDVVQGEGLMDHEQWQIDYLLDDLAEYVDDNDEIQKPDYHDYRVTVSVRFPFWITEELTRRVRGYADFLAREAA
jgi:hypothetical protein